MAEHKSLIELTDNKEELLQKSIIDYLSANPVCLFNKGSYNIQITVNRLFEYLDYANNLDGEIGKRLRGDSIKQGMTANIINAFKILFIDSRDSLGKINFQAIDKADLLDAYSKLNSAMESFGLLVAVKNFFYQKNNLPKQYMLGAYTRDITTRLAERYRFNDEESFFQLTSAIKSVHEYRNNKSHNDDDKTYLFDHIYKMILFMCVSVHIGFLLSQSRFGGVRYEVKEKGTLYFTCNGETIKRQAGMVANFSSQFIPVYQFNLKAKWQPEFDCKIVFESPDGKILDTKCFDVKNANFVTFKYAPKKEKPDEKIQKTSQSVCIPKVPTTVKDSDLLGRPFLSGIYKGPVDEKGMPHGKGMYETEKLIYDGVFDHGKPIAEFTVRFEEPERKFVYRGNLNGDFLPDKGYIRYLDEDKVFDGTFSGWAVTNGKKIKAGKLVYEGDFFLMPGENGVSFNLYHGKGVLYDDAFRYEGGFSCGQMDGQGVMTFSDPNRPPLSGVWSRGEYMGDKPVGKESPVRLTSVEPEETLVTTGSAPFAEPEKAIEVSAEPEQTVMVLLSLPDEPVIVTDEDSNVYLVDKENPSIELPPNKRLTAVLESDSRVKVTYLTSEFPGILEQWNLALAMEELRASLPAVVGTGKLTLDDGSEYEGQLNCRNQPHGNGTLKTPEGHVYTGEFADGKYEGQGTLQLPYITYTGGFKAGLYHGSGKTVHKNGDTLEGNYVDGRKQGKFTQTTARGMVRVTYWSNGHIIS